MSEEELVKGVGGGAGDSGAAGGDAPAGAPADDVSQAELVRQFGDEFRRSMQAAIDRDGPEVF